MSKSLSDSLSKFISSEQLAVPSDEENVSEIRIQSFEEFMDKDKENREKRKSEKKKSKKKESFEDMINQGNELIDSLLDDDLVDDFDGYLDGYMLDDEDKKDVKDNIDKYSLDDIESKLSVICVRKRVSFANEVEEEQPATTFSLEGLDAEDDTPEWIKAVLDYKNNK